MYFLKISILYLFFLSAFNLADTFALAPPSDQNRVAQVATVNLHKFLRKSVSDKYGKNVLIAELPEHIDSNQYPLKAKISFDEIKKFLNRKTLIGMGLPEGLTRGLQYGSLPPAAIHDRTPNSAGITISIKEGNVGTFNQKLAGKKIFVPLLLSNDKQFLALRSLNPFGVSSARLFFAIPLNKEPIDDIRRILGAKIYEEDHVHVTGLSVANYYRAPDGSFFAIDFKSFKDKDIIGADTVGKLNRGLLTPPRLRKMLKEKNLPLPLLSKIKQAKYVTPEGLVAYNIAFYLRQLKEKKGDEYKEFYEKCISHVQYGLNVNQSIAKKVLDILIVSEKEQRIEDVLPKYGSLHWNTEKVINSLLSLQKESEFVTNIFNNHQIIENDVKIGWGSFNSKSEVVKDSTVLSIVLENFLVLISKKAKEWNACKSTVMEIWNQIQKKIDENENPGLLDAPNQLGVTPRQLIADISLKLRNINTVDDIYPKRLAEPLDDLRKNALNGDSRASQTLKNYNEALHFLKNTLIPKFEGLALKLLTPMSSDSSSGRDITPTDDIMTKRDWTAIKINKEQDKWAFFNAFWIPSRIQTKLLRPNIHIEFRDMKNRLSDVESLPRARGRIINLILSSRYITEHSPYTHKALAFLLQARLVYASGLRTDKKSTLTTKERHLRSIVKTVVRHPNLTMAFYRALREDAPQENKQLITLLKALIQHRKNIRKLDFSNDMFVLEEKLEKIDATKFNDDTLALLSSV